MMHRLCGILLCVLLAGCDSGMPRTIPVTGKVLFDGDPPPATGTVYFTVPADAAGSMTPATGDFDATGVFRAKTFKPGDGLLPGRFKLRLECYETPPNMEGKEVKSHLPPW